MRRQLFLAVFGLLLAVQFVAVAVPSGTIAAKGMAENVDVDSLLINPGIYDSPEHLVSGNVPGISVSSPDGNVATSLDVVIRGLNSVYSSTSEPLWIVDGVELSTPFGQQVNAYWLDKYADYSYMSRLSQLDFINLYDIKSIQVIKNVSATSLYGPKGANGVIVINTRNASSDAVDIDWASNFGYDRGFRHNHNLAVSQNIGNSSFRVSAFYKDHAVSGNGSDTRFGGLRAKYDSHNFRYVWFGLNFNLAVGKQASAMTADYDDYSDVFRSEGSLYVQVNFLPSLKWRTELSIDSNNSSRYFWNGLGTEMGKEFNRTAALAASTLFDSKAATSLVFDRYFGKHHHFYADASFDFRVDNCNFNNMDGEGFFNDALRVKGFNLKESSFPTYRVKRQQQIFNLSGSVRYDYKGCAGISLSVNAEKNAIYDDVFTMYPAADVFLDVRKTFFPYSSAVSDLKLTGGWGKASFSRYAPWRLVGGYLDFGYAVGKLAERGIEIDENVPEKNIASSLDVYDRVHSAEYHVGGQIGFIGGRIGLDVEYYSKISNESVSLYCFAAKSDSYIWKNAPRTEIFSDMSDIRNRGVELTLKGKAIATEKSFLDFRLSAAYNLNSLESSGNGMTQVILGTRLPQPKYFAFLGANFGVGNFSADIAFDGGAGYSVFNIDSIHKDYLRLSRLEVAYHFPLSGVKWIKGMDMSLSGTNLFTINKGDALPMFRSVVLCVGAKF